MTARRSPSRIGAMPLALLTLVVLVLLEGCGGGGDAASSRAPGSNTQGTVVLSLPSPSRSARPRQVPATTTSWRIELRDPETSELLVPTTTVPVGTQSVTLSVRVGRVRVLVAALNASGTVLVEQSSTVEVVADVTATVDMVLVPLKLRFLDKPGGTTSLRSLAPFRVAIVDDAGNVVDSATDTVSLTLRNGPPRSVLVGSTSASAVAGIATFSNVGVSIANGVPDAFVLGASAPSAGTATSGSFTLSPLPISYLPAQSISLGTLAGQFRMKMRDLNGDGLPDLVTAGEGSEDLHVYLNDGGAGFHAAAVLPIPFEVTGMALEDVDGDGHVDIAAATRSQDVYLCFGRGDGTFPGVDWTLVNAIQNQGAVEVVDLDRDGRKDVVAGLLSPGSGMVKAMNVGSRTFPAAVSVAAEPIFSGQEIFSVIPMRSSVAGTGPDLVALGRDASTDGGVQYYRNDGHGVVVGAGGQYLSFQMGDVSAGEVEPGTLEVVGTYFNQLRVFPVTARQVQPYLVPPLDLLASGGHVPTAMAVRMFDLEGAGKLDLVSLAAATNDAQIFQRSAASYTRLDPPLPLGGGVTPDNLQVLDINGDRLPDIVCLVEDGDGVNALRVFLHAP